jgi:hypothetical protein
MKVGEEGVIGRSMAEVDEAVEPCALEMEEASNERVEGFSAARRTVGENEERSGFGERVRSARESEKQSSEEDVSAEEEGRTRPVEAVRAPVMLVWPPGRARGVSTCEVEDEQREEPNQ